MNMRKARRVRNNGIRHERLAAIRIDIYTRPPAPIEHSPDHGPLPLHLARKETIHARYQAGILDHESHETGWVAADGVEI
jgi:hypothetical protein